MCGIVGYIGKRQAQDVLLEGLTRLEYRGYDSAGIAIMEKRKKSDRHQTKIQKSANIEGVLNQKTLSVEEGAVLKIKTETHQ